VRCVTFAAPKYLPSDPKLQRFAVKTMVKVSSLEIGVRSRELGVGSKESRRDARNIFKWKLEKMGDYKSLLVFQKAYALAMEIFETSKRFPKEEQYSLTDQIRRSSRSVCTNIGEAYKRRRYKAHFLSKLNDSESENTETEIWINFARDCLYLTPPEYEHLLAKNTEVGKLLWYMAHNPDKFL